MSSRTQRSPALVVSALIHAAIIAAAVIVWPMFNKTLPLGKVVPVTLVTTGPPAEEAAAVEAPKPAPAETPQPVPEGKPEPAPIKPLPPAPPTASATPKPEAKTKPTPAKQTPSLKSAQTASAQKASRQDLDLDALMTSIDAQRSKPSGGPSSGKAGPMSPRAEKVASEGHGEDTHMSASEIQGLKDKLSRLWNPNCSVEAAAGINIKVHFRLSAQGFVVGQPELASGQNSTDPIFTASAARALSAVGRGQPYTDVLNPAHFADWHDMVVNFNAKQACAQK